MQWVPIIAVIAIASAIFLEDFKNRSVHLFYFLLLGVFGFINSTLETDLMQAAKNSLINICLLSMQTGILFLYLKYIKKHKTIVDTVVGKGDLFFLLICCFLFSPVHFLCYYVLSLLFSLLLHILFKRHKRYMHSGNTVALAGWQALFLIITLSIVSFFNYNLSLDQSIVYFFIK